MISELIEFWKTRLSTPAYALFGFWWVVLNLQVIDVWLFVDEKLIFTKFGLLKNEYIERYYCHYTDLWFWAQQTGKILIAGSLTYLMIWVLPKRVLLPAFVKQREHYVDKQIAKLKEEKRVSEDETALKRQEAAQLEAEDKKVKVIKNIEEDFSKTWEKEYEQLKSTAIFSEFPLLLDSVYLHDGILSWGINNTRTKLSSRLLAYADSNGLVEIFKPNGSIYDRIRFTTKGKFFVKQYNLERTQQQSTYS